MRFDKLPGLMKPLPDDKDKMVMACPYTPNIRQMYVLLWILLIINLPEVIQYLGPVLGLVYSGGAIIVPFILLWISHK
jgi:hypothetical protein